MSTRVPDIIHHLASRGAGLGRGSQVRADAGPPGASLRGHALRGLTPPPSPDNECTYMRQTREIVPMRSRLRRWRLVSGMPGIPQPWLHARCPRHGKDSAWTPGSFRRQPESSGTTLVTRWDRHPDGGACATALRLPSTRLTRNSPRSAGLAGAWAEPQHLLIDWRGPGPVPGARLDRHGQAYWGAPKQKRRRTQTCADVAAGTSTYMFARCLWGDTLWAAAVSMWTRLMRMRCDEVAPSAGGDSPLGASASWSAKTNRIRDTAAG